MLTGVRLCPVLSVVEDSTRNLVKVAVLVSGLRGSFPDCRELTLTMRLKDRRVPRGGGGGVIEGANHLDNSKCK